MYAPDFSVLFFYDSFIYIYIKNFLSVNAMLMKALKLKSLETEVIWLSLEQPQMWHQDVPGVFPGYA